ncbi:hypothetical protein X802_08415 [Thermococcus guaymasensis DSM 11113]|uniref:Uncharacterized protein n=1 Tax=Thermococcus guaymasensis DSM 11113 TaxID=1432656 RepID=A0A0X1KNE6_9EURY|nr:hypothetical protein X802_08415 [Thermococcus guaymasensis DSM 11113]
MGEVREKKLYVCLRCGNKFWSRAKKPQCSVCKSKRVIPYEEFLQLPQEEQERILGKRKEENEEQVEAAGVKSGESGGNSVKIEESPEGERVKSGDSPKITGVKKGEKQGERVKGERVKREISIPKPRLSWKAVGLVVGLAFLWYLYKTGWFDSVLEFLGVKEKEEPVKAYEERRSPLLGKIESNLRR